MIFGGIFMKTIELYASRVYVEGYPKGRHANYKYMLLEGEKEIENLGQIITLPCFGIQIVREDMEGDVVYAVEKDSIECMTTFRYKAIQLLKKLYDNCVSPIHLIDIAGPLADEWVDDFEVVLGDSAVQ
jgi:hypothetical protein